MSSIGADGESGRVNYSKLVDRIAGESVDAWAVHYEGLARRQAGEDIIVLSVGQETGELTPAPIVDAAVESLRRGRHHYMPVNGERELRTAISRGHRLRTGQVVDDDNCVVFAGAQNALFAVAQCVLEAGDEVIFLEPYYTTYPATFSAGGAKLVSVPTRPETGFQPDPEALAAAFTRRTRALVLNSPNNPTGAIYTRDRLEALVQICAERDIWIVSDEVYAELATPGEHCSPCSLPGGDRICVTVSSFSKSHRMTGWRMGWVVAPKTLCTHLSNLAMCMSYGLPAFIQDAALAALRDETQLAPTIRAALKQRADTVVAALQGIPGISVYSAGGGMFLVLDIRGLGISGERFAKAFLDGYQVAVLPCDGFGPSARGLLRISLCESEPRLLEACHRLRDYVGAQAFTRQER